MIPDMEFIIWIVGIMQKHKVTTSYTRIQKTAYLLKKYMQSEKLQTPPYSFGEFYPHTGPNDPELTRDIPRWGTVGLLEDSGTPYKLKTGEITKHFETHHINLTNGGRLYFQGAQKDLSERLGKTNFGKLLGKLEEYVQLSEKDLVDQASAQWIMDHPDDEALVKRWLAPASSP